MEDALSSWSEDVVWVRAPNARFDGSETIPLISSPNRVIPDRIAMEALAKGNRRWEVVFSAYDRIARYAAAFAGLGYLAMARRLVPESLVIEQNAGLPCLPSITAGIITREGLDPEEMSPLIGIFEAVLHGSSTVDDRLVVGTC